MRMDELMVWALIIVVSLIGSVGNILWKVASNSIGQVSWQKLLDIRWDIQTIFSPLIFAALFLMFLGRFASVIPTGYMGITQLVLSITILTLVFTSILDNVFLKTHYPIEVWIGVILGLVAVYLIGRSV
jgi:hypothetical protein